MSNIVAVGLSNNGINKHYIIDNISLANLLMVNPANILGGAEIVDNVTGGALISPYVLANGGIVDASFGVLPGQEFFTFEAQNWNLVKNISVIALGSEEIFFAVKNFVHADLDFSTVDANVVLIAENGKRGNYATGSGNDIIEITSATNNNGWSNLHQISTGSGDDTVIIGPGDQFIKDTTIVNFIDGRFTKTEVFLGTGDDRFEAIGGVATRDLIRAGDGNDTIYSGNGDDFVSGDADNDLLYGGQGNDTLKGQTGNDKLFGESGADILWGNDGDDILYGGADSDWMKAGKGSDGFILGALDNGIDTIYDLRISKGDYIQIKDILDFNPLSDAITDFVSITHNGVDSFVSVDIDGALNGQSFVQIAQITSIIGLDVSQLDADGDLIISNVIV